MLELAKQVMSLLYIELQVVAVVLNEDLSVDIGGVRSFSKKAPDNWSGSWEIAGTYRFFKDRYGHWDVTSVDTEITRGYDKFCEWCGGHEWEMVDMFREGTNHYLGNSHELVDALNQLQMALLEAAI